jgi:hypothetical protein
MDTEKYRRKSRGELFPDQMEMVAPWSTLQALASPLCERGQGATTPELGWATRRVTFVRLIPRRHW